MQIARFSPTAITPPTPTPWVPGPEVRPQPYVAPGYYASKITRYHEAPPGNHFEPTIRVYSDQQRSFGYRDIGNWIEPRPEQLQPYPAPVI